jgi:hypothetical protein
MLQLLSLPHGMLSIGVKLALVVHDLVQVAFEEGGRSWWICHVGFATSFARPGSSVVVVFSVRTMCGARTGGWSLPCVMSDCQRCMD